MRQPVSNAISAHFWEIKRSLPDLLAYRGHTKTAVADYFGGYTLLDSTLHFWIGVNSPIRMTVTIYAPFGARFPVRKISFDLNPPPLVEDPDRFYRSGEKKAGGVILLPHSGRPQEAPSKGADNRSGFDLPLCDAPSIAESDEKELWLFER